MQIVDFTSKDLTFQRLKLAKKIVESSLRNPRRPYGLQVDRENKSAVIETPEGTTKPIKFKNTSIFDENNAPIQIPASVQMMIFSLLFRNEPVSVSFLLKKLSSNVDNLFELGNALRLVNKTIGDSGLSVIVSADEIRTGDTQEFVGLGSKTDVEPALRNEKTSREIEVRRPDRERRRGPSHRKLRI